jgi:hypothetical protein
MHIFKWKILVSVMLVGLCCGGAMRAFADEDGKDKPPAKPAATKIDARVSDLAQTKSADTDSTALGAAPNEKNFDSPAAVEAERGSSADERGVSEAAQSPAANEASATNQEPKRRALPAPLDGIFPGTDYLAVKWIGDRR